MDAQADLSLAETAKLENVPFDICQKVRFLTLPFKQKTMKNDKNI